MPPLQPVPDMAKGAPWAFEIAIRPAARLFRNTSWWEKRFESSLVKTIA
jgi:hypothetical protein